MLANISLPELNVSTKMRHFDTTTVLALPINGSETQIFEINEKSMINDSAKSRFNPWRLSQDILVKEAMLLARQQELKKSLVVPIGVMHFGHFLGDLLEAIVSFIPMIRRGEIQARILLINTPLAIKSLLDICDFTDYCDFVVANSPTLFKIQTGIPIYPLPLNGDVAPMAMSSEIIKRKIRALVPQAAREVMQTQKVFLTADRQERIANIEEVKQVLSQRGYKYHNPLLSDLLKTLSICMYAKELITENGSILFNTLLTRESPYSVLCSRRSLETQDSQHLYGGNIYNNFHDGLINYIACQAVASSKKHPFADQLEVDTKALVESMLS